MDCADLGRLRQVNIVVAYLGEREEKTFHSW